MELVGRFVAKKFRGSRVFQGLIESYDPSTGFFRIAYEDGSAEELGLSEATSLVESVPQKEKVVKKRGRKPKKRHWVRDDPGKGFGNSIEINGSHGSGEGVAEFGVVQDSNDGVKFNGGLDLNLNEGLSLDVGSEVNVNAQQNSGFRGSIDLNSSAVNDVDEGFGNGEKDAEKERKERGFDLNLVFDDENVEVQTENGVQLMDIEAKTVGLKNSTSLGDGEKIDVGSVCLNGSSDVGVSAQVSGGDPCLDSVGGEQNEKESARGNASDVTDAANVISSNSKVHLQEGEQEVATPVLCEQETNGRRKRRKILGRLSSPEEGCLRRSARRAKALAVVQSNEASADIIRGANDISSSGMSVVSEDEEKPGLPDCEGVEEYEVLPQWVELPPSSTNLNLEGIPVLDLFSVYACLRSFSILLYLSPFGLEDFVASLKSKVANTLLDSVHVAILQTLRKHLEVQSSDGSETASICLRNLNWDLLDVVTWPIFLAEYLLVHSSGSKPCFSIGSLKLVDGDYYKQLAGVKIAILQRLCDDVIEVECMRTELSRRTSAFDSRADFDRNFNNGNFRKTKASLDTAENTLLDEDTAADTNDRNSDECCLCKMEGNLICCDGCPAAYHSRCVGIASSLLPEGEWYCPECVNNGQYSDMKPQKLIRGAELLGADPYGRMYFHCYGYLLVSRSCDTDSLFGYYYKDDFSTIIHVLESSGFPYGSIARAISKRLMIHTDLDQRKSCLGSANPSVLISPAVCKLIEHSMPSKDGAVKGEEERNETKPEGLGNLVTSPEGSAEVVHAAENTGLEAKRRKRGRPPRVHRKSFATKAKGAEVPEVPAHILYVNHYSFARVASSIAEDIAHKPSNKISQTLIKSEEEIISSQMKTISKKATMFCWPTVQNICVEMQKEKCGWCYSCRSPDEDRDCLFNLNSTSRISHCFKSELDDIQSKQNKKGHLIDVTCYILSMEHRLRGLLLGPWRRPDDCHLFLRNVLKASDFTSVKHRLLLMESNLRPSALSADWERQVDLAVTMGSASHIVISTRVSSKFGIGRKRNRFGGFDPTPVNANGGLVMLWWRGGQVSRKIFNWKILPRSLALKAARKGGCIKIPGLLYADGSEHVKRSKQIAWRAAVEMSTSVAELALQVRELDLNIRWDEIENTHVLSTLDKESQKSIKLFKKVIVRRKCVERTVVKYLLDFGKRRLIPDVVQKHGSKVDDPTSERKKYWLEESYLPLHLLRNFEEKRIARKAGKTPSSKVLNGDKALKKTCNRKGLEYLFARAERSNYYQCGHCKKDVPISEAVSCQFCKGYFHKRHVRKSLVVKKCTYTCHGCQSGKRVQIVKKKGKVKLQKIQYKNGMKPGDLTGKVKSKRGRKPKADNFQMLLRKKKRVQVSEYPPHLSTAANINAGVPLRRSARKAKCAPVLFNNAIEVHEPVKKRESRKRTGREPVKKSKSSNKTGRKPAEEPSFQRKRTRPLSTLWKNGLQFSRKPDDDRAVEFKRRKLLIHSEVSAESADQPKCTLCGEEGYTSALNYIACEICGDWYHGDAFGLDAEVIKSLIGFRCHACLKRSPPVCPFAEDAMRSGSLSDQAANNAGAQAAQSLQVVSDPNEKTLVQNCASEIDDRDCVQVQEVVHNQTLTVGCELRTRDGHSCTNEGHSTCGLQADASPAECNGNLVLEENKFSPPVRLLPSPIKMECLSDKPEADLKDLKEIKCLGEGLSNLVVCEPIKPDMEVKNTKDTDIFDVNSKDPKDTSNCVGFLGEDLSNSPVEVACEPMKPGMEVKDVSDIKMPVLEELTTLAEAEGKSESEKFDAHEKLVEDTDMSDMADLTSYLNFNCTSGKADVDAKALAGSDMSNMAELTSCADVNCHSGMKDADASNAREPTSLVEEMEEDTNKCDVGVSIRH